MNTHERIQRSMRKNEVELLAHIRAKQIKYTMFLSIPWHNALDRLVAGKMVTYVKGLGYRARSGARPVTPAVRTRTKAAYDRALAREERGYPKGFK
jgi:hypothetical protein